MPVNPYQKYQQQSVMTMTPGEMLLKLYDEVITQLTAVKQFNEEKDYQGANAALKKSQRIISYLDQTLDPQYEISGSLSALYDYFIRRLVDANMHKENGPIDEVLPMIEELRDTFAQADKKIRLLIGLFCEISLYNRKCVCYSNRVRSQASPRAAPALTQPAENLFEKGGTQL